MSRGGAPDEGPDDPTVTPGEAPTISLSDIRGIDESIEELQATLIESATSSDDLPADMRMMSTLLHGPQGAGKRRIARAIAGELGKHGYQYEYRHTITADMRMPLSDGLEALLESAREHQPITLLLDCFDNEHFDVGAIRAFKQSFDRLREAGDDVVVIAVMEAGQLFGAGLVGFLNAVDLTISLEHPDIDRRREILEELMTKATTASDGLTTEAVDIDRLARETSQFDVPALERLARRAATTGKTEAGIAPPLDRDDLSTLVAAVDDERPTQIADEYMLNEVDVPDVTFDDIGGLDEAERKLREQVNYAFEEPVRTTDNASRSSGILLHGPPGTGKTMLVQALANELEYTLIPVEGPKIKTAPSGPAQKISELFERANRNSPAILFFDEIDTLGGRRNTRFDDLDTVNTLLTELDGLGPNSEIVVVGATNLPNTLDPALLRPDRFDYHVEVGRPDEQTQAEIFELQAQQLRADVAVSGTWFADMTDDLTGAEIGSICERATTVALRSSDETVPDGVLLDQAHFETAYEDFQEGRIDRAGLADTDSPAFQ